MRSTIIAQRLLSGVPGAPVVEYPLITIEDGRIASIESIRPEEHGRVGASHRFLEATLVPAYLDIHIHGCAGHDVMEATPEALDAIEGFLARRGVAAYLPTTVTATCEKTLSSLRGLAKLIRRQKQLSPSGAEAVGIHLEGPFLSHEKRGVHTASLLETPSIELFTRYWEAAEGAIRLMTIAPELPEAEELIAHATKLGVRCSLGHSDATAHEAELGMIAGACSATHTFNAMRRLDHREPGLAGFVLDQDSLFAEIICDGIHVNPSMVRLFLKAKGAGRVILVTDGMSATGMPDGDYLLGEMEVQVRNDRCMFGGTIAGSVLTLERAVENFIEFTGTDFATATGAASRNPAAMLGAGDRWGRLEPGRVADLTVLSANAKVLQTFIAGEAFDR